MDPTQIVKPIVEWGFAGIAAVQLGIIVWLIRRLLDMIARLNGLIERNTLVVERNTKAIKDGEGLQRDHIKLTRSINDRLLSRPCIATREN